MIGIMYWNDPWGRHSLDDDDTEIVRNQREKRKEKRNGMNRDDNISVIIV